MFILSLDNPVFIAYCSSVAILTFKMLIMVPLVGRQRFRKGIFISPEDVVWHPKGKVVHDDEEIERPRRAHLNDLENIPIFLAVGFIYLFTNPAQWLGILLFRVFTAMRLLHTVTYALGPVTPPVRGVVFFIGYFITSYMALSIVLTICI